MFFNALMTLTVLSTLVCASVRRYVWRNQWERPITLAAITATAGLILQSPQIDLWIGPELQALCGGRHEPEDVWALWFYQCAQMFWLYALSKRLHMSANAHKRFLKRTIALPAALVWPHVAGLFWLCPDGTELALLELALIINQLLLVGVLAVIARDDKRSRAITFVYMFATITWTVGIAAQIHAPNTDHSWIVLCVGTTLFSLTAMWSQVRKQRELQTRKWAKAHKRRVTPAEVHQD